MRLTFSNIGARTLYQLLGSIACSPQIVSFKLLGTYPVYTARQLVPWLGQLASLTRLQHLDASCPSWTFEEARYQLSRCQMPQPLSPICGNSPRSCCKGTCTTQRCMRLSHSSRLRCLR